MLKAAKAVVKCFEKESVTTVFGYPGATILPLFDALIDSDINNILVRNEQNAGHAASGFARANDCVGVCIATSGPGATNLITAIASAYMDSIPMVIITGQVNSELIGRDVFQEADITGACEPFVKHSYLVKVADQLPKILKEAFNIAKTGRPGPVLIDIPVDVLNTEIKDFAYPKNVNIIGYKPCTNGHAMQIKRAVEAINKAKKPVICVGGGVFTSCSTKELIFLAEKTDIPVINTLMGIGAMPQGHRLKLGMFGTHGIKTASYALYNADLLIVCGARLGDRAVAKAGQLSENTTVIHIDIDPAEIGKNIKTEIPIVGDLRLVLNHIIEKVEQNNHDDWLIECTKQSTKCNCCENNKIGFVNPKLFLKSLTERLFDGAFVVCDVGQNQIWAANNFFAKNGRFLTSGGMGTMGYSLPAAIGVKTAKPDAQVVCICGDGGFQMTIPELATLMQNQFDVKIIVINNHTLGMIRELQDTSYGGRHTSIDLHSLPDIIKIADAYGIQSARINANSDIDSAITSLLNSKGAYLLEVNVDPECSSL